MQDILTITLNPSVDVSTCVPSIAPGPKLRCDKPSYDPGGGGINVSRAIKFLGGESRAFISIGGGTGAQLLRLLDDEDITFTAFSVIGNTRQSISVTDSDSGEQLRFVMPGPQWEPAMVSEALHAIEIASPAGGIVVLSGSQPPGVSIDFPARLSNRLAPRGDQLFIDTSGAPLHEVVDSPSNPFVLRMDDVEAEDLAGRKLTSRADTAAFALELVRKGAGQNVIVARGADGSTLVNETGCWHARCAVDAQDVKSAVGAGDSFVGAFCMATAAGENPLEALKFGTAAAAAAVMTEGTRLCDVRDVERLLPKVEIASTCDI